VSSAFICGLVSDFFTASTVGGSFTVDILAKIVASKRARIERAKQAFTIRQLRDQAITAREAATPHALLNALEKNDRLNIIAEFKRRSPSKGVIREGLTPPEMARLYKVGGAAAISVLTEEDHFDGSLDDLRCVKAAVSIPVLRKDFIVDEYQVFESAAAGADALLLIAATLDDKSLVRLRQLAEDELGMDALVEVHSQDEMERGVGSGARLIGVNNRDLRTFEVSLDTSVALARDIPANVVLVSESGLKSNEDLQRLGALGYRGFLIGESLMRAERPDQELRRLIDGVH
jgi:indole-3-glycerol phosphate synthase